MGLGQDNWPTLLVYFQIPMMALLVGIISMLVSDGAKNWRLWYDSLRKPPLTPRPWVFGLVWPVIYTLLFVAGFLGWQQDDGVSDAIYDASQGLWFAHVVLNALWTPVFFAGRRMALALVILVLVVLTGYADCVLLGLVRPAAAYVFIPNCIWISFALYLNIGIVMLNGSE